MINFIRIHFKNNEESLFETDNYDKLDFSIAEGFVIITQYRKHYYYHNSTIEWIKREDVAN